MSQPEAEKAASAAVAQQEADKILQKDIRTWLPGECFREGIKWIIQKWVEAQPDEAKRFQREASRRRAWNRDNLSGHLRKHNIAQEFYIPARVYKAMAVWLAEPGQPPCDWLERKDIRKIFFDEMAECKLMRHPGGPNGAR